jgi:hypothetical protein
VSHFNINSDMDLKLFYGAETRQKFNFFLFSTLSEKVSLKGPSHQIRSAYNGMVEKQVRT